MKTYIQTVFMLLLVGLTASCNLTKAPEFKGISKIDLLQKPSGKVVLVAYAKYLNPNLLGGKFKIKDIQVFANGKYVANINSDTYKVPSKKEFEIPLEVDFDEKFIKKDNLLEALGNLINNKMKIQYKGKIFYVSHGLNIPYSVDYEQDVKLLE